MANATSCFEQWLREAQGLGRVQVLERIAQRARTDFDASVWFVEIQGKRWSHVAGEPPREPTIDPIERIPVGDDIGLTCAGWGTLDETGRAALLDLVREVVRRSAEA